MGWQGGEGPALSSTFLAPVWRARRARCGGLVLRAGTTGSNPDERSWDRGRSGCDAGSAGRTTEPNDAAPACGAEPSSHPLVTFEITADRSPATCRSGRLSWSEPEVWSEWPAHPTAAAEQGQPAMSAAAQEIEQLRSKLTEVQDWAARCQDSARIAADELVSRPSIEGVALRDQRRAEAEVAVLEIERIRRQLREAEERAGEDERARLRGLHADEVVGPAQAADQRVRAAVSVLEEGLGELNGLRNKARSLSGQLRAAGDAEASLQLNVRRDNDLARRLERLLAEYERAMRPVG